MFIYLLCDGFFLNPSQPLMMKQSMHRIQGRIDLGNYWLFFTWIMTVDTNNYESMKGTYQNFRHTLWYWYFYFGNLQVTLFACLT